MFRLYFNYRGKDLAVEDCYGITFSPAGRNMCLKVNKDGRIITQTYRMRDVENFMLSLY